MTRRLSGTIAVGAVSSVRSTGGIEVALVRHAKYAREQLVRRRRFSRHGRRPSVIDALRRTKRRDDCDRRNRISRH
jgi:hypothetical protein